MKAKRIRKMLREQVQQQLDGNIRIAFSKFCGLCLRERIKLAWLLVRGDDDLNKAAG